MLREKCPPSLGRGDGEILARTPRRISLESRRITGHLTGKNPSPGVRFPQIEAAAKVPLPVILREQSERRIP